MMTISASQPSISLAPLLPPAFETQPTSHSRIIPSRSESSRTRMLLRCRGRTETATTKCLEEADRSLNSPNRGICLTCRRTELNWLLSQPSIIDHLHHLHHRPSQIQDASITIILAPEVGTSPLSPESFPISDPWQAVPADEALIDEAPTPHLRLGIVPPRSAHGDTNPLTDATTSYSSISTSATTVPVESMLSPNREDQSGLAAPHRRPSVRYVRTISLQRLSYQPILSTLVRNPRP